MLSEPMSGDSAAVHTHRQTDRHTDRHSHTHICVTTLHPQHNNTQHKPSAQQHPEYLATTLNQRPTSSHLSRMRGLMNPNLHCPQVQPCLLLYRGRLGVVFCAAPSCFRHRVTAMKCSGWVVKVLAMPMMSRMLCICNVHTSMGV